MKKVTDENRLSTQRPDLVNDWNFKKNAPITPDDISCGSNQYVWWICRNCGYEWHTKVANRAISNRGCPCCANKVVVSGVNDLATRNPELAKEWHPSKNGKLTPAMVMLGTAKKVWWLCPQGHEYLASVLHRGHGTNCPICNSGRQTSFAEKAIFYYIKKVYPDAVHRDMETLGNRMELDIFIPSIRLAIEYDGAYWHDKKRVKEREKKKFLCCQEKGINLLRIKEQEPCLGESSARWTLFADPSGQNRNLDDIIVNILEEICPQTGLLFRKTYGTQMSISVDTKRDRFDIIGSLVEKEKWAHNYPLLLEEWHSEKNGSYTLDMFSPGSDEKMWWKCNVCGNEWRASIGHRVNGTGCSICFRKGNRSYKHYLARKVYQYTENGTFVKEWQCVSDAGRELNINTSNISMCAKGQRRVAGGFVWRYDREVSSVNQQMRIDDLVEEKG